MVRINSKIKINAFLNSIRQGANIILPLLSFPYLTRVLQIENYGKVAFGASIVSYFSLIAALGVQTYSIREGARIREDKGKITEFANQVFTINMQATFIAYLLLFFMQLVWGMEPDIRLIIAIQSTGILCTTVGTEWIPALYEEYLYITVRSIGIQLISLACIFMFVKDREDYLVYVLITAGTSAATCIVNRFYSRKYIKIKLIKKPDYAKHLRPIVVLFANSLMITIYLNSDITMLGIFKGDADVGIYKVAVQVYTVVKSVLNAMVVVAIPKISAHLEHKDFSAYGKLASDMLRTLFILTFPALTGLYMLSRNIILIVGGKGYLPAVIPLRILCFALFAAVVGNFCVNAILITNRKEKEALTATVISAAVNVILNLFFIPAMGYRGAAFTTLTAEVVVMALLVYFSRDVFTYKGKRGEFISVALGISGIIGSCLAIDGFGLEIALDTGLKILVSILSYFGIYFITNSIWRKIQ